MRCEECGFEYVEDTFDEAGDAIVAGAAEIASLARDAGPEVATRRVPEAWSALEYACHVRDVLLVQRERVLLARRTAAPSPASMGRDERVEHDGYADQDPTDVARQLADAAALFANVLGRLGPDDWIRTIVYEFPEPTERSLRWVAVHTRHEVEHHLGDVRRQLDR